MFVYKYLLHIKEVRVQLILPFPVEAKTTNGMYVFFCFFLVWFLSLVLRVCTRTCSVGQLFACFKPVCPHKLYQRTYTPFSIFHSVMPEITTYSVAANEIAVSFDDQSNVELVATRTAKPVAKDFYFLTHPRVFFQIFLCLLENYHSTL